MRSARLPNCTVGFVYNEPCPLKCDFCCHTKVNVGPGRLTPANVTPILIAYARHPHVTRFAFTGGDPFIYIEEILEIMSAARMAGVIQPFHVVTSGYWAKSDAAVDERLRRLKAVGMDMLYVSHDLEHRKWVPAEYVYRIERYCDELGVVLSVYGVFWEPGTNVRDLLPELRTPYVNQNLVAPIGRAKEKAKRLLPQVDDAAKYSCGKPQDYDITIYPNGETYPCCSGGFNKEGKLLLGNSFTDPPETIIQNCYSNFFVIIAKELGFDKLYEAVRNKGLSIPGMPQFADVSSVCEVCSAIHANDQVMTKLQEVFSDLEVDYTVGRYLAIVDTTDAANAMEQNGESLGLKEAGST